MSRHEILHHIHHILPLHLCTPNASALPFFLSSRRT